MIFSNSGAVIGESEGVQIDDGGIAQIINSGDIFGLVKMGSGDGLYDGRVTGSVFGEKGADILHGGRRADEFDGGADADLIFGGSGGDRFGW